MGVAADDEFSFTARELCMRLINPFNIAIFTLEPFLHCLVEALLHFFTIFWTISSSVLFTWAAISSFPPSFAPAPSSPPHLRWLHSGVINPELVFLLIFFIICCSRNLYIFFFEPPQKSLQLLVFDYFFSRISHIIQNFLFFGGFSEGDHKENSKIERRIGWLGWDFFLNIFFRANRRKNPTQKKQLKEEHTKCVKLKNRGTQLNKPSD